jgi:hypothetical protein
VPGNADKIANIQQLKKLIGVFTDNVLPDVNLQAGAIARDMGESCFSVRPKGHDPSRGGHMHRAGFQLLYRTLTVRVKDFARRLSPGEFMGIPGVAQGFDVAQISATLLILIQRFKFQ